LDTLLTHGLTFFLAATLAVLFMIATLGSLLRQRRSPGATVSWLIFMILLPPIGLPAYFFFGGRKMRKLSQTKAKIELAPDTPRSPAGGWVPISGNLLGSYGLAPPASGNNIHFHANGEEAFADLIGHIDGARQSISIQTYEMKADDAGKAILAQLAEAAKRGVKVRLLMDGLGALGMSWSLWQLWKLRRAGVAAKFFLPVWKPAFISRTNLRNHRKIAVFDDARVFAGGRNLATNYLGPQPSPKRWRDLSFMLEGPAVADFAKIFRYDWAFATKEEIPAAAVSAPARSSGAVAQVVPEGPDMVGDPLYATVMSALYLAQKRIWIVSPYFVPDAAMSQALIVAAKRGVDVRIIVPEKPDEWIGALARGPYLRDLRQAGAKVRMFTPSMLHGKAIVIDDKLAMAGSANFDQRSMFLNFEVMCLIYSAAEIQALAAWMDTLVPDTQEGGLPVSTFRDTVESVAFLLTPLL
jgi:cardiolipin synthase A/B